MPNLKVPMFETLTEESAYWIGILASDGNIAKDRPRIRLGFHVDDKTHIEKFKNFIGSESKISYNKKEGYSGTFCINVTSSELVGILNQYGLTPKKSNSMVLSGDILECRHFWRGMFDGDGSITHQKYIWKDGTTVSYYPQVHFCGNANTVEKFKSFLSMNMETGSTVRHRDENLSTITITKNKAKQVLHLLYDDISVSLDRKYNKALSFIGT